LSVATKRRIFIAYVINCLEILFLIIKLSEGEIGVNRKTDFFVFDSRRDCLKQKFDFECRKSLCLKIVGKSTITCPGSIPEPTAFLYLDYGIPQKSKIRTSEFP